MRFNGILSAAIAAGIALATVACQKIEEQSPNVEPAPTQTLTVTATIADIDGTKVSYGFTGKDKDGNQVADNDKAKSCIKQTWEEGDEIFGFDESGDTFTFTVASVDPNTGKATFTVTSGENLNGNLYAVYYPGKSVEDIRDVDSDKIIDVDLSNTDEDDNNNGVLNKKVDNKSVAPVIMCATAEIKNDAVSFNFTNQTAIVGIYRMQLFDEGKPVDANTSISSVTLNGVYTKGTIQINDEYKLGLVADNTSTGSITANVSSLSPDKDGYIEANVKGEGEIQPYFSVIPGDYQNPGITVTASGDSKTYSTTGKITGKIEPSTYRYIGKKMGTSTVASINGVGYFTISDAFAAVKSGETIKLEESCTVDSESIVSSKTDTKTVTLDLNGKILTQDGTKRIGVAEGGDLTITDNNTIGETGTITQTANSIENPTFLLSAGTLTIKKGFITKATDASDKNTNTIAVNGGTLNVDGGTISNAAKATIFMSSGNVKIHNGKVTSGTDGTDGSNAIAITGGDLTMDGGEISNKSGAAIYIYGSGAHSLSISNGTIIPASNAIYSESSSANKGTVSVTGGEYRCKDDDKIVFSVKSTSNTQTKYVVQECVFEGKNISDLWLSNESILVQNEDEDTKSNCPKRVAYQPDVTLKVGTENLPRLCTSVNDAFSGVASGSEAADITLYKNQTLTSAINVANTAGVNLDLNNKEVIFDGNKRLSTSEGGTLNIKNGTINCNDAAKNIFYYSAGKITLTDVSVDREDGSDSNTAATISINSTASFEMTGGTITRTNNLARVISSAGTGDVTITNATIYGSAKRPPVYFNSTGKLSITGSTISGDTTAVHISQGTLEISGGEFKNTEVSAKWGGLIVIEGTSKAPIISATITNAKLESSNWKSIYATYANNLTIDGSTLSASQHNVYFYRANNNSVLNIKGDAYLTVTGSENSHAPIRAATSFVSTTVEGGYFSSNTGQIFSIYGESPKCVIKGGKYNLSVKETGFIESGKDEYDEGTEPYRYVVR